MSPGVRGYKTELDLNHAQITACKKHAGCARKAFNWGLTRKQEARAAGLPMPNAKQLHKELNALKASEFPYMYEVSKCAPQEALIDLDDAFKHFFRKATLKKRGQFDGNCGYPKLKSRKKGITSMKRVSSFPGWEPCVSRKKATCPPTRRLAVPPSRSVRAAGMSRSLFTKN